MMQQVNQQMRVVYNVFKSRCKQKLSMLYIRSLPDCISLKKFPEFQLKINDLAFVASGVDENEMI